MKHKQLKQNTMKKEAKHPQLVIGKNYYDPTLKAVYMYDGEEKNEHAYCHKFLKNAKNIDGKIFFEGSPLLLSNFETLELQICNVI